MIWGLWVLLHYFYNPYRSLTVALIEPFKGTRIKAQGFLRGLLGVPDFWASAR